MLHRLCNLFDLQAVLQLLSPYSYSRVLILFCPHWKACGSFVNVWMDEIFSTTQFTRIDLHLFKKITKMKVTGLKHKNISTELQTRGDEYAASGRGWIVGLAIEVL